MDRPRAIKLFGQAGQGAGVLCKDLYLLPGSRASVPPAWSPQPFEQLTIPVSKICEGPVQSRGLP